MTRHTGHISIGITVRIVSHGRLQFTLSCGPSNPEMSFCVTKRENHGFPKVASAMYSMRRTNHAIASLSNIGIGMAMSAGEETNARKHTNGVSPDNQNRSFDHHSEIIVKLC